MEEWNNMQPEQRQQWSPLKRDVIYSDFRALRLLLHLSRKPWQRDLHEDGKMNLHETGRREWKMTIWTELNARGGLWTRK
jgi:hypothetical protein